MREPGDLTPRCDGCNQSFDDVRLGPILHDATWLKLADEHAVLCDLHSPHSWYDLFLSRESEPLSKSMAQDPSLCNPPF